MSVINKMLKDLEQRERKPDANFGSTGEEPSYQPKKKVNLTFLLTLMLLLIFVLAASVSWLLLNQNSDVPLLQTRQTQPVEKLETMAEVVAQPQPQPVAVQDQQVAANKHNEVEPTMANISAQPVIEPMPLQPQFDVIEQDRLEQQQILSEKPQKAPSTDDTAQQQDTVIKPSQFKIEKTPTHLTREQRIEKLMEKAKTSFDKGYITDAISQLEELLNSADGHVEARNLLAVAWYGRGELQQAVNILNNGLNRYPNVEKWRLTAAKIYFKENQLSAAFSYLEANLTGASLEYYSMKGTLARQLKRFDKAEAAYQNLTKLEPNKGSWWLGHAISLDSQNKSAQAVQSYQQVLRYGGVANASIQFAQKRIQRLQEQ